MTDTRRRSIASVAAAAVKTAGGPALAVAAAPHRPNMEYARILLAGMNTNRLPPHAIRVEGKIDDAMVGSVRDQLRKLPPSARRVLVAIDSPGGYLSAEREIVAALAALEKPVDAHVTREAASAAACLLARCEYRTAAPGAKIMFHLSAFTDRPARYDAKHLRGMVEILETADRQIVDDVLRERLRLSNAAVGEILAGQDWEVTSAAAERMGIIHRITSAPSAPPPGWRPEASAVPELKDRNRMAAKAARDKEETARKLRLQTPYSPRRSRRR